MDKTVQEQLDSIKNQLTSISQELYRNNFSSHQDFNKSSNFTTRLKIPHYDTLPQVGEIGELIEVGGALYICSTQNRFTLV